MEIILLSINKHHTYDSQEFRHIRKACEEFGGSDPIYVYSIEHLIHVMESCVGKEFLLFANFPPDSSYYMNAPLPWPADSYDISIEQFKSLCEKHNFKAIHIITGAPATKVNKELVTTFSSTFPVTVKHTEDWHEGTNFEFLRRCYMVNEIKRASF